MALDTRKTPSAIDALGEAISHMRQKLFPFSFLGWITLGFVSLLDSCGASSGGGSVQNKMGDPRVIENPGRLIENVFGWIASHMLWVVLGLMAIMVVSLIVMWVRSRAIFVYIDDVSSGRFDLIRPWSQHGALADSFFAVSLVLQGAMFIVVVMILALGAFFVIWARAHQWAGAGIALGALPILFLFLLSVLVGVLLGIVLRDFVAPIQMARNIGAQEAGGVFFSILSANFGLFFGYAVLKFAVWMAATIVMFVGMCLTCCIGAIPLINQTLFQPVYYAERAWSLKLLAQMGEDVFPQPAPPPEDYSPSDAPTGPIDLSAFADSSV